MSSELSDDIGLMLSANASTMPLSTIAERVDSAQLAANSPCEDCFNRAGPFIPWEKEEWIAATVLDGHSGRQAADHLEQNLLRSVQSVLQQLSSEARKDDEMIQAAIEESFLTLDKNIIDTFVELARDDTRPLAQRIPHMEVAESGSCALLVLYNPTNKTLYTACTGDSLAVLGVQEDDGSWKTVLLNDEQNGENEAELARVVSEHPGEKNVVDNKKVLGLAVTRAFGNFSWKSCYNDQLEFGKKFGQFGPKKEDEILTPPYLTAKPVVTVTKLDKKQRTFLVLATDGFWNNVAPIESVDLVVRWLEARQAQGMSDGPSITKVRDTPETVWWKTEPQKYTFEPGFHFELRWHEFDTRFVNERTILKDLDNAAVHLLRNCFGGAHDDLLRAKLGYTAPFARNVRDDTTVQVVFF